jgi:hypothetical protein
MVSMSIADREQYYFEMFREAYGLTGALVYGDKPDVIVHNGGRSIGIEITNFFLKAGNLPESEQRQRLERQKVVEQAHRSYVGQNGKRFELTFRFNEQHPILDRAKVSSALVTLARRAEGNQTGQLRRDLFEAVPELTSVWLNAKEYEDARWRVAQVYDVPIMSLSALGAIINDKERKADQYRACDAYWLLVVVDFIDAAQDQEIPSDILKAVSSPVFENVLIYKPQFGQIVESRQ